MINIKKSAIYCNSEYGPYFGGRDFSIESNMKTARAYAQAHITMLNIGNIL